MGCQWSNITWAEKRVLNSMQVDGNDNLDFTKQDYNNYLRNTNKQQRALKHGEDIRLERTFSHQLKKNPSYS